MTDLMEYLQAAVPFSFSFGKCNDFSSSCEDDGSFCTFFIAIE
jgi:hypothetical protein